MPYDAKAIANHFISLAHAKGENLTQMKLQKLVYFAHGWTLGIVSSPLIDELVQAWSYGPVIFSLYKEFREFGSDPITRTARILQLWDDDGGPLSEPKMCEPIVDDKEERRFLDKIWETYGKYTPTQLTNMTHADGTPWHKVYMSYNGKLPKYTIIPQDLIRDYFSSKCAT